MGKLPFIVLAALAGAAVFAQSPVTTIATESFPSGRMCYDEVRQRIVVALTGGAIWEHDGAAWGRAAVQAPASGQMIYNPYYRRVYFVGTDVQVYDGSTVVPIGPCPGYQRVVANSQSGRLLGVRTAAGGVTNGFAIDEFDGLAWSNVTNLSGFRIVTGAAFDRERGCLVLQVLQITPLPITYETWEWDGSSLAGPFVDGIGRGICEYDATRRQVVALGSGSTWAWDGAVWTQLPGTVQPMAASSMACDEPRGHIWLFASSPGARERMWLWDGAGWSLSVFAPHPEVYYQSPFLTFDAGRGRAVLLGQPYETGQGPLHAEWNGLDWLRLPVPGNGPSAFSSHAQAYDAARSETVVFGGLDAAGFVTGDTWAFDGASWRLAATSGPAPRQQAAVAYDAIRGRVVVVGGISAAPAQLQDHWEWDGASWSQVLATTPMGSVSGIMGFDPLRDRLVLQGVDRGTYEYDGSSWQLVATVGPRPAYSRQLVWNPKLGVLQGVLLDANFNQQLLTWDGAGWTATAGPLGEYAFDLVRDTALVYGSASTLVLTASPATVTRYGAGCGGVGTATSLMPFRQPRVGDAAFHLDLRGQATLRPAMVGLGFDQASLPLGNGCTFLLQGAFASRLWFTDGGGFLHLPMPLPAASALRGVTLTAQGAVLDPASPGGVALSQGLELVLGD